MNNKKCLYILLAVIALINHSLYASRPLTSTSIGRKKCECERVKIKNSSIIIQPNGKGILICTLKSLSYGKGDGVAVEINAKVNNEWIAIAVSPRYGLGNRYGIGGKRKRIITFKFDIGEGMLEYIDDINVSLVDDPRNVILKRIRNVIKKKLKI